MLAGSVSPGLNAPRVAGSFPNPPRFRREVRETSSHPRCVQSRTELPASMFVIVFVRVFTSDWSSITPCWLVQPAICTYQNLINGCKHRLKLHFCCTFLFCVLANSHIFEIRMIKPTFVEKR